MAKKRCRVCNKKNDSAMKFCIYCGNKFEESKSSAIGVPTPESEMIICRYCKQLIPKDSKFCVKCGNKLTDDEPAGGEKEGGGVINSLGGGKSKGKYEPEGYPEPPITGKSEPGVDMGEFFSSEDL